jgi:uncharacterized protein (DUF1697 family)
VTRRWVALLYSVVLPGGRLAMADLRDLAAGLGLGAPRTLLATGNLLFEADAADAAELEARLEPAFAARFGKPASRSSSATPPPGPGCSRATRSRRLPRARRRGSRCG